MTTVQRERMNRRLAAQQLAGPPAGGVEQVVDRLLAVQAQDLRAARLAVRARTTGLTSADVDRELETANLVVTWLNRGTLHLVQARDYWWLQRLTTPQLSAGNARRLGQEGVSPDQADRGVAAIQAAISANGPRTRAQLREAVAAADVPVAGQALVHILALSAIRGLTVRGPLIGTEQGFVLVRDWLGQPPRVSDRSSDLSELARRFLAVMVRLMNGTWPSGPASPLVMLVRACVRPAASWRIAPVAWLTWLDVAHLSTGPAPGCSAGSTLCCTAGSTEGRSWARTRRSSRRTVSSGPSRWWMGERSPSGVCRATESRSSRSLGSRHRRRWTSIARPQTSSGF